MSRAIRLFFVLVTALALVATACGSEDKAASPATTTATTPAVATPGDRATPAVEGEILVAAAASLTEAYTEIGSGFEKSHPGTKVTFNFDSSSTLAQQVLDGAPVDVYASADEANTTKLVDAEHVVGEPAVFARNQLAIVTKPGNPKGVTSLADLMNAGVIALCGKDVPCGKFATQALEGAGVTIAENSVTRGQNVKATLTAVTEGDAVAAVVYVTDAAAAGPAVTTIDIPAAQNVVAVYPVSVLKDARNQDLAEAFVAYVLSEDAQVVLKRYGFVSPT
ncbi:MAG: molybdate ABC transporter substrate-binding protein [Aquihabitans sp.]